MKALRTIALLSVLILVLFLSSCGRFALDTPEGFAEVRRQGYNRYLAVSPEGVKISIRTARNYPKQDLEFWQAAMEDHLRSAGYTFIEGPEPLETKKTKGVYFEWGAPYQGKDYAYFTGLIVSGRKLLILEAGGEYDVYNKYKPNILKGFSDMTAR